MNTGIHDATVATTDRDNSLLELQAFLAATESMVADGGGDGPEIHHQHVRHYDVV